jgi:HK97 family phage prohead protease
MTAVIVWLWQDRDMEKETRFYNLKEIEVRADDGESGEPVIDGYAATYDAYSEDLGGFVEVIERGFFDGALQSSDVVSLWNHNSDKPLGRQSAGTLTVTSDLNGLRTVTKPPDTTWGKDAVVSIKRGDVKQMSFAFSVTDGGDSWETRDDGVVVRTLLSGGCERLYDISPVTYPAYPSTSVSARALDKAKELTNTQAGDNTSQPETDGKKQARIANRKRQLDILRMKQ